MGSTLSYHVTKHKRKAVNGLQRHIERVPGSIHANKNIVSGKTVDNIFLSVDSRTYQKRFEDELKKRYTAKRKPRSDAVALVSQTVQFGGDIAKKSLEEQIEVLRFCHEFLSDRYGVCSSVIHLDETTPHLHICYIPITSDGRLSARDFTSRKELQKIQTDLLKAVQFEFEQHGFARADEQGRGFANGQSQRDFERLMQEKEELEKRQFQVELAEKANKIKERELLYKTERLSEKIVDNNNLVMKYNADLKKRFSELSEREREVEAAVSYLIKLREELVSAFNDLIERAKKSLPARKNVKHLEREYPIVTDENLEDFAKDLQANLVMINNNKQSEIVL